MSQTHVGISRLHFAMRRWIQPNSFGVLDELLASQWWPHERIRELQERRLRDLCVHAYQHTRYYREAMDAAGMNPNRMTIESLQKLPILEKATIQRRLDDLTATTGIYQPKRTILNATGGSTGEPIRFYQDYRYQFHGWAELWRDYFMCGYQFGAPHAFVWGSDYDSRRHGTLPGDIRDYLQNVLWLNAFKLTEESLQEFADKLVEFKPQLLIGYVSSLTLLARVVRSKGIPGIRPSAVQTSAEVLTGPQRSLIEDVFGAKAFDRYGCREVGNIAHECQAHEGLHILSENNLVEVVRGDGTVAAPQESGYLVVTNLINNATPFIRYRIGDLGTSSEHQCSCGRGLPVMKSVQGRSADVITAPNGRLIHGEFFTHLFYKFDGVKQFRVEQESVTDLRIQISPSDSFDPAVLRELEELIHAHGDPRFNVRFELLDHIPPAASGKFRFTVSQVPLAVGRREPRRADFD
jgi:phenylacetate-coenzyme A ligase PaaK-like adenylate-forming protein